MYYDGVEGEMVARPGLIPKLLVIAAQERICGCIVGLVSGSHL